MNKHLLSLAFAITFNAAAMAQTDFTQRSVSSNLSIDPISTQMARTPAIQAGEGQVWWANYDQSATVRYIMGTDMAEHYDAAVFIPSGLLTQDEMTVDGFSFFPLTDSIDNVKVWVCPFLPANNGDRVETVSVDRSTIEKNVFNDVVFKKQHVVPVNGLYVGISFDVVSVDDPYSRRPLSLTNTDANRPNSFFYKTTSKRQWTNIEGNAYVKVLFGGGNFIKNAVTPKDFATNYVVKGESVSMPMILRNMGVNDVSSISYTITTDGVTSEEYTKGIDIKGYQQAVETTIDFPADDEAKAYQKTLTITKVNGQKNETSANKAEGQLITVMQKFQPRPVVELFIGTGYDYSPYGMVGLEKTQEKYGDEAVLIAVHCDDVMAIKDYIDIVDNATSVPSSFLNRQYAIYPSPFNLQRYVGLALDRTVPAKIRLAAEWIDDTTIKLDAATTFGYTDNKADYGIAYVLLADGLKGTGEAWEQKNGYSGMSAGEDLKFWSESSSSVADITYNHVAIAAKEIFSGETFNNTSKIEANQRFTTSTTMSISGNTLVQDKSKLTAVALLIDRSNNQIINASQTSIAAIGEGIESLTTQEDENVTARYDMAGRRVSSNNKGISIVKMANGKSRKIVR